MMSAAQAVDTGVSATEGMAEMTKDAAQMVGKAKQMAQGTMEAVQNAARTKESVFQAVFDSLETAFHYFNEVLRCSAAGRTFVTLTAVLISPPVLAYVAYGTATASTTLSIWAVAQMGILGFGLLFLLPVLGFCLLLSTGAAATVAFVSGSYTAFCYVLAKVREYMSRGRQYVDESGGWGPAIKETTDIAANSKQEWQSD